MAALLPEVARVVGGGTAAYLHGVLAWKKARFQVLWSNAQQWHELYVYQNLACNARSMFVPAAGEERNRVWQNGAGYI